MKKYISMMLALVTLLTLGSCSKDDPFGFFDGDSGRLITRSMTLSLSNEVSVVRGAEAPEVADFTVNFIKEGESEPAASYKYSEMPEIVTLPVGKYTAVASYGENASADWEKPYYKGVSEEFEIRKDEITDNVAPVVCKLANVKVTITLDDELLANVDPTSHINVCVGQEGSIDFSLDDIANGRSAFFAHVENSRTLAATFIGKIQGYDTNETKAYDNVAPGNHYKITFRLHKSDYTDPGFADGDITVDATVTVENMNKNVDTEDDLLVDDMRPTEGTNEEPVDPQPAAGAPTIIGVAPINIDIENNVDPTSECKLIVKSEADGGITAFDVYIISNDLNDQTMQDVGLTTHLNLAYPGEYKDKLGKGDDGLGLPVAEEVLGQHEVLFDITGFMPLLAIYPGHHEFKLVVSDANGTTTKTLKLNI